MASLEQFHCIVQLTRNRHSGEPQKVPSITDGMQVVVNIIHGSNIIKITQVGLNCADCYVQVFFIGVNFETGVTVYLIGMFLSAGTVNENLIDLPINTVQSMTTHQHMMKLFNILPNFR